MSTPDKQKLLWHSRRGMLELDLLLVPFAREGYDGLDRQEQTIYREFLREEDQDLLAWLMGAAPPPNEDYRKIIGKILAHGQKGG